MPRVWVLVLILVLLLPGLYAQELPSEDQTETWNDSDFENYSPSLYTSGDKTFTISVGTALPTYFGGIKDNKHGINSIGGTGSLAFAYFLNSNLFLGGEISGMFVGTLGGNMLYLIPMGLRFGYQFIFRRFEFPVTLMVGGAPQLYLEDSYFGLFVKAGASMFWRFNPDWSFGLNAFWWFVPQWKKEYDNVYGNFLELTLSARYHF